MNRKLLSLAIGAALSLPLAAQAAPTVYGLLDLSLDRVMTDAPAGTDNWQVVSNSSRLGVKGEESLGGNWSAVYQIEYGVTGDTAGAAGTDLAGRNRFVGLKGDFGTVRLGAIDSPLKSSQGTVDQFNDLVNGDMAAARGVVGDYRLDNVIYYTSPKVANAVTFNAAIQPGEAAAGGAADRLADAFSASAVFEQNNLYAALAFDKGVSNGGYVAATARDTIRLSAGYKADALQLGAMLQTSEMTSSAVAAADQDTLLLSAAYGMDEKSTIKAQIVHTKDDAVGGDTKANSLQVGFDHAYTKMTKVYVQAGYVKTDAAAGDREDSVVGAGIQTKF